MLFIVLKKVTVTETESYHRMLGHNCTKNLSTLTKTLKITVTWKRFGRMLICFNAGIVFFLDRCDDGEILDKRQQPYCNQHQPFFRSGGRPDACADLSNRSVRAIGHIFAMHMGAGSALTRNGS